MKVATLGDLRKRLSLTFEEFVVLLSANLETFPDLLDATPVLLTAIQNLEKELKDLKTIVHEHKELRHGNVLNALMELETLVSEDHKGSLDRFHSLLKTLTQITPEDQDKTLTIIQADFVNLKTTHTTLLKFLEAEGNLEIKNPEKN